MHSSSLTVEKIEAAKNSTVSDEVIYSTFMLDNIEFGLNVECVNEAVYFKDELIKMPTSIDIVEGVINLRGSLIPVINLRKRFGFAQNSDKIDCLAIVFFRNRFFALSFENISEVIRVKKDLINEIKTNKQDKHLCNSGLLNLENEKKIVQLLDLETVFKDYDLPMIENQDLNSNKRFLRIIKDITFNVADQEYALEMTDIKEIIKVPEITKKADTEGYIKGVINIRGRMLGILDFKEYLNQGESKIKDTSRIIVLNTSIPIGIIVDSVNEVISYEIDKQIDVPQLETEGRNTIFSKVISLSPKRNILRLNPENLTAIHAFKEAMGLTSLYKECKDESENTSEQCARDAKVYITFRLKEAIGIDAGYFQEIINYSKDIMSVPSSIEAFEGLLNLRGNVIPVINLRKYYNLEDFQNIMNAKVLVMNVDGLLFGIIVDDILEILKTDSAKLLQFPKAAAKQMMGTIQNHITDIYQIERAEDKYKLFMILDIEDFINKLSGMNSKLFNQKESENLIKENIEETVKIFPEKITELLDAEETI